MPFFETETSGNWTAESCSTVGTGALILTGPGEGFAAFADANNVGSYVWYSVQDGDNREAGIGLLSNSTTIVRSNVRATLVNGVYTQGDGIAPIALTGSSVVSGTFNASALNALWDHIWDTDNPHSTQWDNIIGKPATFPPSPHTHVEADITDLDKYTQAETDALLNAKEDWLDNPLVDNYVLASLTDGTRFWTENTGDGAGGEDNIGDNVGGGFPRAHTA